MAESKREIQKQRMAAMSRAERSYVRRTALKRRLWKLFRFLILFGIGFVILYPLL